MTRALTLAALLAAAGCGTDETAPRYGYGCSCGATCYLDQACLSTGTRECWREWQGTDWIDHCTGWGSTCLESICLSLDDAVTVATAACLSSDANIDQCVCQCVYGELHP